MTDDGDRAGELGRFAAREFIGRWSRETGEKLSPVASDRMQFAYEMGYLRGRNDAMQELIKMFGENQEARKTDDDDSDNE